LQEQLAAVRLQLLQTEEELLQLRRSMEAELELTRSRHTLQLEQILEQLAASTLRFSR
jgi:hypothetical protein